MRILVISDVHGRKNALRQAVEEQPTARQIIFLGDGLRDAECVAAEYPNRDWYMVPGNCDFSADLPTAREETFGGKRFFFTHGHIYRVKYGLYTIDLAARERQADIVLFGHTHRPHEEYADGLTLFNPGSLGEGHTYGYVDVVPGGMMTGIVTL